MENLPLLTIGGCLGTISAALEEGMRDMNEDILIKLNSCSAGTRELFLRLRDAVYRSVDADVEEKMWAGLPSYYVGERFVRLIPFKDHVNVEAKAVVWHKAELQGYELTPKGMLQIYLAQDVPSVVERIFKETLQGD